MEGMGKKEAMGLEDGPFVGHSGPPMILRGHTLQ